jgi:tetratricopeptide (TPR) repeat protein
MSKLSRIEMLKSFAEQDPDNPFNWYALALEHQDSDPDLAKFYFNKLLTEHKVYLATYYHAAGFFSAEGNIEKAKEIFESGIKLAEEQKNEKTLKELKNSYQNFLFENDID